MKNPLSIIFGGSGQDGKYLAASLRDKNHEVVCFNSPSSEGGVDVGKFEFLAKFIKDFKPDFVFHLAARSSTDHKAFLNNQNSIVNGTANILEAVDRYSKQSKVFVASSALIFQPTDLPISENFPTEANSAYSLARIQSLEICRYYRNRGRKVYVGFLFSHESQYRPKASLIRQITRDVLSVKSRKLDYLNLGSLDTVKEWTWAGDVVEGICLLVHQNAIFELVIGSGVGHSIREYVEKCFEIVGLNPIGKIKQLENFSVDYHRLVSKPDKLISLGWTQKMLLSDLALHMLKAEGWSE